MILKPAHLLAVLLASAVPAMAQNVATVNGKAIPNAKLEAIVKQAIARGQKDSPQLRDMIKQNLIAREVVIQEAEKSGLEKNGEVKQAIESARQGILIDALMYEYLKKNPVSDAEIQAFYDKEKTAVGDKEFHISHIVVEKEDDAKALISKLKSGAKFEELAKQSKDTTSGARGGDLDWTTPAAIPQFAQVMTTLQKGQFTETPIKTDMGYHIVRMNDSRAAKFPALEEIKPQIVEAISKQKVGVYQQALMKKAKVQ